MASRYTNNTVGNDMARARFENLRISFKQSIEMSNFLKGKKVSVAKNQLEGMIAGKVALPMRRYNSEGAGHKRGKIGPGRFPVSTASGFHDLLENVEVNANGKGLDVSSLKIVHLCAQKGPKQPRYGRSKRGVMKRTHVEVIVQEIVKKQPKKVEAKKAEPKKATPKKVEAKKVEAKEAPQKKKPEADNNSPKSEK